MNGRLLKRHKAIERHRALLRKVHEDCLAQGLEALLDAVLHHVVKLCHQVAKMRQLGLDPIAVGFDVHRRPRQRHHSRAEAQLQMPDDGTEQRLQERGDQVGKAGVFGEAFLKSVTIPLEALLLQHDQLGVLGHRNAESHEALRLANQLQDLRIEVYVQLASVGMADDERRLQPSLCYAD
eukprot:scaffold78_cov265-Pinguiococcus_pyrenoidosus.AAC.8